jgi:hypothetical protein
LFSETENGFFGGGSCLKMVTVVRFNQGG